MGRFGCTWKKHIRNYEMLLQVFARQSAAVQVVLLVTFVPTFTTAFKKNTVTQAK